MEKINKAKNINTKKRKRILKGEVVSNKMDKTIVVKVSRLKLHPKYKKHYQVSQNFKAHDEENECQLGDRVIIEEIRPLSRDKKWKMVSVIPAVQKKEEKEDKGEQENKTEL